MSAERGSVIAGWLAKVVAGLAIAAVVVFDALSIGATHLSAQDDAATAATAGSEAWSSEHSVRVAYDAAAAWASQHDERVPATGFSVDRDGTVHLRLSKQATTVVLAHLGPLSRWANVTVDGDGTALP
jgi:hypothetical protein